MEKNTPTTAVAQQEQSNSALTVVRAAFAFRDALDESRAKKASAPVTTVQEVKETSQASDIADPDLEAERAHMRRNKRNIRVARAVQHLLTSLLSLAIIALQSIVCAAPILRGAKNEPLEKTLKALLPTLMLLVTAVLAIFFDACALTAYLWPETKFGIADYKLATQAHYIITTFKSVAYTYSTLACAGSNVSNPPMMWSMCLSAVNIGIEIFGLIIDQYVKRDAERFKGLQDSSAASPATPTPAPAPAPAPDTTSPPVTADSSDKQSLLPTYSFTQHRPEKLGDAEFDKLDTLGNSLDADLQKSTPKVSAPPM